MVLDGTSKFAKGNKQGRGNPMAAKCEALRMALYKAVSIEDIRAIVEQLKEQAIGGNLGNLKAIGILLDRLLGPPIQPDILARIEEIEKTLQEEKTDEH